MRYAKRLTALLLLACLFSGCAGMHELWNTPIDQLGAPGRVTVPCDDGCLPLYEMSDPGDLCYVELDDGSVVPITKGDERWWKRRQRTGPANGALYDLARLVSDVWNQPFLWRTQPPPEFVDPTPYRDWATQIDYPQSPIPEPATALFAAEPRRLRNTRKDEIWDMTLEEAIQIALSNSHVIRSSGQFLNPGNQLLNNPDFVPSSLDPAIQESGVLFGQRGVEAALSEFDTQWTTTMIWGRDEQIQNSNIGTGVPPGQTLTQETANFSSGLTKRLATGGVVGVIHEWNYLGSNIGDFIPNQRLFPSTYTGRVRVEARQPLWAGAGTEYTRIAGPVTDQIQGVTGVQQGVVIARINNDIELTQFKGAIRDLLRDVESLYWQLYLAYQSFDSEMRLMSQAVDSYRNVEALIGSASPLAGALEESDAIEFVYQMQARVDLARDNLYDVEAQLRRIIGLDVNDGKVIRPLDEPTIAEFVPDWSSTLSAALAARVELQRQKWNIKQIQLQLRAAEHLVKPRLDVVAAYQVNGFGDDLRGDVRDGVTQQGLGDAVATLTRGDQTGWNLGLEFSVPLGLRFAHTQVKNLEFRLAKANIALAEAEKEISHELADTFRELDRTYLAMTNNLNRKRTAERRVAAVESLHLNEPQRYTQDSILRARDQLTRIEQTYLQSVVEYNVALMEMHYRSGNLLEFNNVTLSEGPWDAEAYYDVEDRGYDRWHSVPTATMLHHEPEPFAYPGAAVPMGPPVDGYGPAAHGWSPPGYEQHILPPVPSLPPREDDGTPAPPITSPREEQAPLPPELMIQNGAPAAGIETSGLKIGDSIPLKYAGDIQQTSF